MSAETPPGRYLFDPWPYGGPPKSKRRKPPPPPSAPRVDDDPRWRVLAGVKGVDAYAHLMTVRWGTTVPLCGKRTAKGRPLELQGTRPLACPQCLERRGDAAASAQ